MKKLKFGKLALPVILACAFSACKKEANMPTEPPATGKMSLINGQSSPRPLIITDAALLNTSDANLEQIDMALYSLGNVFKDLINQNIIDYVITRSTLHPGVSVTFNDVFNQFPSLLSAVNNGLAQQQNPAITHDFSSFNKIVAALERNGIQYDPALYIPNMGSYSNSTANYFFSPNVEIADEQGYDDQLMAWFKSGSTFSKVKINEAESKNMGFLVLTMDLKVMGTTGLGGPYHGPGGPSTPLPGFPNRRFLIRNVKLWDRLEKPGNTSEVYLHIAMGGTGSWTPKYTQPSWGIMPEEWTTKLVNTKDMGTWHNVNKEMAINSEDVVWNIFERDWGCSFKEVNALGGMNLQLWGAPMRFANEVYAIKPSENINNDITNPYFMGNYKSGMSSTTDKHMSGWFMGEFNFYSETF